MPKRTSSRNLLIFDDKVIKRVPRFCQKAGKVAYVDDIAAQLAIEDIQKNARRTIHDENRSYRCKWCHGHHLTSQEQLTVDTRIAHSA